MLTLQFGQCGNQVGQELFSAICVDIDSPRVGISRESNQRYVEDALERWFGPAADEKSLGPRRARAVLVDTDEKVLRKVNDPTDKSWAYRACNAFSMKNTAGSANNWARGFTVNGEQLDELLINSVADEFEVLDQSCQGFLFLLSSAGGTGSGFSSRALQVLRDEYPTKLFTAAILLPYTCGEVAVQHYNTVFTLSQFNHLADVVFLFENGQTTTRQSPVCPGVNRGNREKTGYGQINAALADHLIGLLQPIAEVSSQSLYSLLSAISPHPSYKFAIVESAFTECDLLRPSAKDRAVSDVLITRGNGKGAFPSDSHGRPSSQRHVPWANQCERYIRFRQERGIKGYKEFFTLSANNSRIRRPLDGIVQAAWNSYAHRAFLHNYKVFGLEENDFLQAFATMEDIVKNYGQLQRG